MKKSFLLILFSFIFHYPLKAQMLIDKTILHDGQTRAYTVYIPTNYQETTEEIPLLFNFHGGNGDIASQIAISDMRSIADTAGFILVYPQALPDPNDGGSTILTHKAPTTVDDIFFVEAMIDTLASQYSIDVNRVYACGYSNGGEFAFELACRLSNRIAAIGVVARSMFIETLENCAPIHPTGILTIHGTKDDYEGITFAGITFYPSLEVVNNYWSNFNNTDATPTIMELPNINTTDGTTVEHYSWSNGDGCVTIEHFKVINGGHDWPGSFGNMDIDASVEIWNFVSRHDINGLISCQTTAVSEEITQEKTITIFPNPVQDFLTIEMDNISNQVFHLYSITGQTISSGQIDAGQKTIDLSSLLPNSYILKIGNHSIRFVKTE